MTKVTAINKAVCGQLRADLTKLLEAYGEANNLKFHVGNMSYQDMEVSIKLTAAVKGGVSETGVVVNAKIEQVAKDFDLLISKNGNTLVDYQPRKHRYPFIYQDATGHRFQCDRTRVKILFGKN